MPYFVDSEIPSAVFLGLHLLVTDPSTSPRTPLGRAIFGVLYGLGVFALYAVLGALGLPTFYDKLLCVPLLNLAVPAIDRAVRSLGDRPILSRWGLTGRSAAATSRTWRCGSLFFGAMTALGATDGMHRGDSLPFWEQACAANRPQRLRAPAAGSRPRTAATTPAGRATSSAGTISRAVWSRRTWSARSVTSRGRAKRGFRQAASTCSIRSRRAVPIHARSISGCCCARADPNLVDMPEPELYARACRHGWTFACDRRSASR